MGRITSSLDRVPAAERELVEAIKGTAHALPEGDPGAYDPLLSAIGDARIVMLGEASHGTHEFYRERARITTRLIAELGFNVVAIEGDWPEAHSIHRYVQGGPGSAREALSVFTAFPTWMWGNEDMLHFIEWLRRYNESRLDGTKRVSFYGLDLYSLNNSMEAVVAFLQGIDAEEAERARQRYGCFEPFSGSKDMYAYTAGLGISESCEREALAMLQDLRQKRDQYQRLSQDDAFFHALLSAEVAKDAERYYRSMYRSDEISWNIRDCHMVDTLDKILQHHGDAARVVIWEHNTHIGDFRATADADGMVNVGQLVRDRYPNQSVAIGFGTYEGSVTAARAWGDPPQRMTVPEARSGSYDNLLHATEMDRLLLLMNPLPERDELDGLNEWRGQRAIGVVYHPEAERGNYVPTRLAQRYDAYIHIDRTRAVRPLAQEQTWVPTEREETYPSGY